MWTNHHKSNVVLFNDPLPTLALSVQEPLLLCDKLPELIMSNYNFIPFGQHRVFPPDTHHHTLLLWQSFWILYEWCHPGIVILGLTFHKVKCLLGSPMFLQMTGFPIFWGWKVFHSYSAFETGSCHVVQSGLVHTMYRSLSLNSVVFLL